VEVLTLCAVQNVLLKTDFSAPSKCVAKITDFGLSATLDPRQTHISNYSSGTPFYVSPEVLNSGRAVKASDVYSFGVLAW
jgi:serine/threonine protein kinase